MYASDIKHPSDTLQDKLSRLYTLRGGDKKIDLSFRPPFLDLLHALDNPHLKLPPVVHVAGTNGKGSTISIMRSVLESAGYAAHVYTSPHLMKFNERIVLAGQMVSDSMLEDLIDEALFLNNGRGVTFFEITTAVAFRAFSQAFADVTLLEVGLGGRLDCTNVIEPPAITIIGRIALDHMEHLGDSVEEIALEKAGIIKAGTPCIIGDQDAGIIEILAHKAREVGAPVIRFGAQWFIEKDSDRIRFGYDGEVYDLPLPALVGEHQIYNAGLALAALKTLEERGSFSINQDAMAGGLESASWPARLQKLPIEIDENWSIWLDGGHNEDAGKALAAQAKTWSEADEEPLYLVLGMMKHKDPKSFVAPLLPYFSRIYTVDIPGEPDSMSAEDLARFLSCPKITVGGNLQATLNKVTQTDVRGGRILVAGSLYLAGHVLQEIQNPS